MSDTKKSKVKPNDSDSSSPEEGSTVKVHYTGTLEDGEKFDSSEGKDPLEFTIGENQVIPGFETAVKEMNVGDKKKITLKKEDAYGDPNPELVQKIPKESFGEIDPEPGMQLALQHPQSPQPIPVTVKKVEDDGVTVDMNHPLAGKDLNFELELVEVN